MLRERIPQPEPDGECIADVVRERIEELSRRNPPSLQELDEITRLYQLLIGHIVYVQKAGRA